MNTPIKDLFALAEEAIAPVIWTEKKALKKFKEAATPEQLREVAKAFRSLEQRAEAAEAKLAELEKQEPVAWLVLNSNEGYVERNPDVVAFLEGSGLTKCKPLFTRPSPAINLAEMVPEERSYAHYIDSSNFMTMHEALRLATEWNACRAAILRNIEEAK